MATGFKTNRVGMQFHFAKFQKIHFGELGIQ